MKGSDCSSKQTTNFCYFNLNIKPPLLKRIKSVNICVLTPCAKAWEGKCGRLFDQQILNLESFLGFHLNVSITQDCEYGLYDSIVPEDHVSDLRISSRIPETPPLQ